MRGRSQSLTLCTEFIWWCAYLARADVANFLVDQAIDKRFLRQLLRQLLRQSLRQVISVSS